MPLVNRPPPRTAIAALSAIFLTFVAAAAPATETVKPNFIFILIDDLGWRDLACTGSPFYQTPNLDRLAAEGMNFTQAYAACPVCSPTRASILTGKYPARLQLTDWLPGRADMASQRLLRPPIQQALPLSEVTLAEKLKAAGYVSASIGKWHLGGRDFLPENQGFDLNVAGNHAGSPANFFYPYTNRNSRIPGLDTGAPSEYLTDRLTAEAIRFIEKNRSTPFFLYLPQYAVHIPLQAKPDLVAKYSALRNTQNDTVHTNAIYAAMIESVDQGVGRILRKLDELDLAKRTVIVFTSDNGGLSVREGPSTPATSNAPLRAGKGHLHEGGIRVPLLIRWPGAVSAGKTNATPVSSIDFFPTFLEAAGVPHDAPVDGVPLNPLLGGTEALSRTNLFWHYPHYSNQGGRPGGAVRAGHLKLIEYYEDEHLELYDLAVDPSETTNLANQNPARTSHLHQLLRNWRRAVQAQMPSPNPNYDPSRGTMPEYVIRAQPDGAIVLHARDVWIHGTTVRYEPQPHKNTIGYWTRAEDWVSWDFYSPGPATYRLHILQGCGPGSGGSEVEFSVQSVDNPAPASTLSIRVIETKGFQDFLARDLGTVRCEKAGRFRLSVRPKSKPGLAVMDLRSVTLLPVAAQ